MIGRTWMAALVVAAACALPEALQPTGADLVAVAAGGSHSCGLDADGRLFCWGADDDQTPVTLPTLVALGPVRLTAVELGAYGACGLPAVGDPYCWNGVHGDVARLTGAPPLSRLAIGAFPCGEAAAGTGIWCWSSGGGAAVEVPGGDSLSHLEVGAFACGLSATGHAYCWGGPFPATPTAVLDTLAWSSLVPMDGWACGILLAGDAYCFTVTPFGATGTPTKVVSDYILDGTHFVALDGEGNTVVLQSDGGRLYLKTSSQTIPNSEGSARDYSSFSVAGDHTCGALDDGRFVCFGSNGVGQLGDGTTTDRSGATLIGGGTL